MAYLQQVVQSFVMDHPVFVIVLGVILSALGTIQTVRGGFRIVVSTIREIARRHRNRHAAHDFYYRQRHFGYRICEDLKTYIAWRIEEVAPLRKELTSVPLGYTWSGSGSSVEESLEVLAPSGVNSKLRKAAPPPGGRYKNYAYGDIEPAISRGRFWTKSCKISYRLKFEAQGQHPEPFLATTCQHRVDRLVMRVIFPLSALPSKVTFHVTDEFGVDQESPEILPVDPLSGECRVERAAPRPFLRHIIQW